MNRIEAIRQIIDSHPDAAFVLSNGLTSREAGYLFGQNNHLYLLHGMGEALSVAIGLRSVLNNIDVVVVDGDGNALMGLSAWSMLPIQGIYYYVLVNGVYETTGAQPIPCLPDSVHVTKLYIDLGKQNTPNPSLPCETMKKFEAWLNSKMVVKDV
ncbi:MAG: hypothetical protein JXX29_23205 [Deltaproteobacteria bacterium]|nr:hypothetical protein [Deltaproteobacteria bacterium]MBN2674609.1 hypothetical protein [Deltaproteobacteria bacterium]